MSPDDRQPDVEYDVEPRPAALLGLEKVTVLGRDPRLPDLYRYLGAHPLRERCVSTPHTTYVYFVDPSPEGKAHARTCAKPLKIPHGRLSTMHRVQPGT